MTAFVGLHYGSGLLAGSWGWGWAALGGADYFAAAKLLDLVRQSAPPASCWGFRLCAACGWPHEGILLLNETKSGLEDFFLCVTGGTCLCARVCLSCLCFSCYAFCVRG